LLECGCKSFVYVGTPQLKGEKDMRLDGFKKQLSSENIIFNEDNLIRLNNEKSSEARAKFKEVYNRCEKPVGVFCYHDMLAVKIIGMCNRYGISVPGDILLAGFDNLPLCEYVSPRLTSISYRFDIMADEVVKALFALIENPQINLGHRYVNQSLVVRKSTENK
jgi:DNA-binding LacI/PurR family transcriptional regulator